MNDTTHPSEGQKKGKILIADDTEFFRVVLGDVLKAEGYDVVYAADGNGALTVVREVGDELILLIIDIIMPGMTGIEVIRKLFEETSDRSFPILVMTGFKRNPDEIKTLRELGIEGFISKSEPPRFFVARIKQVLENRGF